MLRPIMAEVVFPVANPSGLTQDLYVRTVVRLRDSIMSAYHTRPWNPHLIASFMNFQF
jgi:hypothetical protein